MKSRWQSLGHFLALGQEVSSDLNVGLAMLVHIQLFHDWNCRLGFHLTNAGRMIGQLLFGLFHFGATA